MLTNRVVNFLDYKTTDQSRCCFPVQFQPSASDRAPPFGGVAVVDITGIVGNRRLVMADHSSSKFLLINHQGNSCS